MYQICVSQFTDFKTKRASRHPPKQHRQAKEQQAYEQFDQGGVFGLELHEVGRWSFLDMPGAKMMTSGAMNAKLYNSK